MLPFLEQGRLLHRKVGRTGKGPASLWGELNVLRLIGERFSCPRCRSFGLDVAASKPYGWSAKESLPVDLVQIARKAGKHPFGEQIAEVFRLFAQLPVAMRRSRRFGQLWINGGVEGRDFFRGIGEKNKVVDQRVLGSFD